ncbi:LOW QUALITY PROTEIN: olfactory receptor 14A16-like, partial [Tachyglossus aculeatus]|uniref:LOW QUALITY PROTEIN: olfactory receptor 14A16-like n=1 Tax=Tachyglossus aculeatus TaxID=9261 RepID=UPI0018F3A3B3
MTLLPSRGDQHHLPAMINISTVTEFLLLGFSDIRELQLLHTTLFLLVYLVAVLGNLLIVAATTLDQRLHTPMYFFLKNLSFIDLCYISTTVPKAIVISLTGDSSISFLGCVSQLFLVVLFAGSELFVLTAMSYDRYAAICSPLLYELIMNKTACMLMAAASWLSGGLFGVLSSASTFSLTFCGSNIVEQFFCDVPPLLKISCSEVHIAIDVSVAAGLVLDAICFTYITLPYVFIFSAVLRMPSSEGRAKAFSTCLPHLTVIIIFLFTGFFAYLKPPADLPSALDLLVSMFYTVVPPTVNPLIYSLRNRDLKAALGRILRGHSPNIHSGTKYLCQCTNSPVPSIKGGIAIKHIHIYSTEQEARRSSLGIQDLSSCTQELECREEHPNSAEVRALQTYAAPFFLVVLLAASELFVLTAMSYDRYAAICSPLRYVLIMNKTAFHIATDVSMAAAFILDALCFTSVTLSYIFIFSAHPCWHKMPESMHQTSGASQAEVFGIGQDTRSHKRWPPRDSLRLSGSFIFEEGDSRENISRPRVFAYLKPPADSPSVLDLVAPMIYSVVSPT